MKCSSVNVPCLKSTQAIPFNPAANGLHSVNSSQGAESLIDDEEVMSTINYSSMNLVLGYRVHGDKVARKPKATSGLFKEIGRAHV